MSLSRREQRDRLRQQQLDDFRAGIVRDLAERGPYYPININFQFNPDFLPIRSTRYAKSALQGKDKIKGLPPHQI